MEHPSTAKVGARESDSPDERWPDHLDALRAAPRHHTLVLENERVRVLETRIPPGETTALHTHRWPAAMVIQSWAPFVRRDAEGAVTVDSRTVPALADPPQTLWSDPLPPHTLENVGDVDIQLISVELKDAT